MKRSLLFFLALMAMFSSVAQPAMAATSVDESLIFRAWYAQPTLDFNKGGSKIYDDTHLRIVTDDELHLDGTLVDVQDQLKVAGTATFNGSMTLGDNVADVITATGYFTQARIGTGTTFGHIGTVGPDELGVEGAVEIDGAAWLDGALTVAGATSLGDGLDVDDALGIGYVATLHQTAVGTASGEVASLLLQNDGGDGTNDYLVVGKNASATVFSVKSATGDTAISGALAVNGATTLGNEAADLITVTGTLSGVSPLKLGGATSNAFEMTVTLAAEPTADVVITIPDITGTLVTTGDTGTVSNTMLAGSIAASKLIGTDIATVGTITTGVWTSSTVIDAAYLDANATMDDVAETISANWVNTTNPWADNEVANDITASNYLPLAGGTMTGELVLHNDSAGAGTTLGSVYYDTDDNKAYIYTGTWDAVRTGVSATGDDLDAVYDNDAGGERTISVDQGTVSWDTTGAYDFKVDIQGTGNFLVEDAGTAVFTVANGGAATHVGTLTVGSDGVGHATTFYSDTAGDYMQWSDSGVALTIIGTNATTALAITDGNVVVTDDLDVSGTTTLDATTIALAAGEAVAISATANTAESLDMTVTAAGNDAAEINYTLVNDADVDTVAALDLIVTSAATGDADALRAINIANIAADGDVVESAIVIGTGWDNSLTIGAGEMLLTGGNLQLNDSLNFSIGTSDDFTIAHDATNTTMTSATGDLIIDNTLVTGSTIVRLGTDTAATDFQVQNNSVAAMLTVTGAGVVTIAGAADETDALILTAGDVLVTDGNLDVAGGDFNVVLDAADSAAIGNAGSTGTGGALAVTNTTAAASVGAVTGMSVAMTLTNYDDDGAADTRSALAVTATNNASDAGTDDNVYGVVVNELGGSAQADGVEYAIYQAGTAWDYGLYVTDASYFGGATSQQGTLTVGVDDTGYDVLFYGATTLANMLWDESANQLKVTGIAASTAFNVATGNTTLGGDFTVNTDDFVVDIDGDITMMPTGNDVIVGADGTGHDVTFYSNTPSESLIWDDGNANLTLTTIVADTTSMNALDLKITDNTSTSGNAIGISVSQESGSGAGFAAGIDVVNNDDTAMTIGERIHAVTGNITTALQIIADAAKTITTGISMSAGDGGAITTALDISDAEVGTAISFGANPILGTGDIGSGSSEIGDVYLADSKAVKFGSGQEVTAAYDATELALEVSGGLVTIGDDPNNGTTATGANDLLVVDGFEVDGTATFDGTLDANSIIDQDVTAAAATDAINIALTANSVDAVRGLVISGQGGSEPIDAGIEVIATDADDAMTAGLLFTATQTITTAIDASSANIGTALAIGANLIDGTYFDVAATGAVTITPDAVGTVPLTVTGIADSTAVIFDLNLKPVSGTVMDMDVAAATTQAGALVGVDMDFSTSITNATFNQTGVKLTMKDGSASGTAIGLDIDGDVDTAIDLSGITDSTDILLNNSESISNAADGTIAFTRDTDADVTLLAADSAGAANLIIDTTLTGTITVGSADVSQIDLITDAASATDVNVTGSIAASTSISATTFVSATTYMTADAYRVTNASALTGATNLDQAAMQAASFWPINTTDAVAVTLNAALAAGDVGRKLTFAVTTTDGSPGALTVVGSGSVTVVTLLLNAGIAAEDVGDYIECLITSTATATCITYAAD